MNAQELIQARITELEAQAKEARAAARDLQKQAAEQDGAAIYAEVQIAGLKEALAKLSEAGKAKPAKKKGA